MKITVTSTLKSTLTTASSHGYEIGQELHMTITVPDKNKWRRFLHWITFRPAPTKQETYRVRAVNSTAFEIIS